MAIKLIFVLKLIFAFLISYSSQAEIKYAHFREVGDTSALQYFPFGSKVGIYCEQKTSSKTNITIYNKSIKTIVANSVLLDRFSENYQFEKNDNSRTSLLTINNLTRQLNDSIFTCLSDLPLNARIRGFNPINDVNPLCTSSYQSRFIFEDSVQSDIEMNCTSEEGDPPVMMSTYIRDGDELNDVTSSSTRTVSSHPHPSKTLSSYFKSLFNNSVFVCNVSQQLPAPYQSYQGSCFFGPILFLPLFSVVVTPSRVMFSDVKNTIFRCTSNVSEVNLSWTNIPIYWKYDFNESDAYIELNVTDTGSDVGSVDIRCVGNYRNKNITSTIQVSATNNPGRVIAVSLVVVVICFCFICVIIIAVRKYNLNIPNCNINSRSTRNVPAVENSSTNNANDGNISINNDVVSPIVSQTDNDNALNVPGMTDNIIYETYTEQENQNKKSSKTDKPVKGEEIEMVENEIYEIKSVPRETTSTSRPDNVNPLYDSISPQHKQ